MTATTTFPRTTRNADIDGHMLDRHSFMFTLAELRHQGRPLSLSLPDGMGYVVATDRDSDDCIAQAIEEYTECRLWAGKLPRDAEEWCYLVEYCNAEDSFVIR